MSLDSTGSTGHFDVSDSRVHKKSQGSYDEMDEEVAEVMGEDVRDSFSEDVGEATQFSEDGIGEGTQPFNGQRDEEIGTGGSENSMLQAWPKPPDVGAETAGMNKNDNNRYTCIKCDCEFHGLSMLAITIIYGVLYIQSSF